MSCIVQFNFREKEFLSGMEGDAGKRQIFSLGCGPKSSLVRVSLLMVHYYIEGKEEFGLSEQRRRIINSTSVKGLKQFREFVEQLIIWRSSFFIWIFQNHILIEKDDEAHQIHIMIWIALFQT